MKSRSYSDFARALKGLLDETGVFSRKQWAELLDVSQSAISQWVNDRSIPQPELLRMVIDVLKDTDGVPRNILEDFQVIATASSRSVSPHGHRFGRSVADYLVSPLRDAFMASLDALPAERKEDVLISCASLSREVLRGLESAENDASLKTSDFSTVVPEVGSLPIIEPTPVVQDRAATELRVVDGHDLEDLVYGQRRTPLRLVNGHVQHNVIGLFNEHGSSQNLRTCAVVLWKISTERVDYPSFAVDEMCFVLLSGGKVSFRFKGNETRSALSLQSGKTVLRMTGRFGASDPTGLPPFSVSADETAIGIGIFYSEGGIDLQGNAPSRIPLPEYPNWQEQNYWEMARRRNDLPVVVTLPRTRHALDRFLAAHAVARRADVHDAARVAGQLIDADVPWSKQTDECVLHLRIVKFSAPKSKDPDDVPLGTHLGQEIIVPLHGDFQCLSSTTLLPRERERHESHWREIAEPNRRFRDVKAAMANGSVLPDVLLVNSDNMHGFRASDSVGAYCLHVRCLAPTVGQRTLAPKPTLGRATA